MAACPGVEAALKVINDERLKIHASDAKEFIVTPSAATPPSIVVDAGAGAIMAIDRSTGAKRVVTSIENPSYIERILMTDRTLLISESINANTVPQGFYRVERSGTEPLVRLRRSASALTMDGEYVYGMDAQGPTRRFRAKISDLEKETTEILGESPLIEVVNDPLYRPYLTTKTAMYLSTAQGPGGPTDIVRYQRTWDGEGKSISELGIREAAINDESIFFIDTGTELKQKIHGSAVTLTLVGNQLVKPDPLFADNQHVYFSTTDTLARVTMAGEATRIVNAIGTWAHQDAACIYARSTIYVAALAK